MNPITAVLNMARRRATVPPLPDGYLDATVDELARALHAVENEGRIARYGAAYCRHPQIAEGVLAYMRENRDVQQTIDLDVVKHGSAA